MFELHGGLMPPSSMLRWPPTQMFLPPGLRFSRCGVAEWATGIDKPAAQKKKKKKKKKKKQALKKK
eukprot:NODE_19347_length_847_cov_5.090278.p7 GENE.NODE_19347_length_847_cov_5.090278~~NODE_19347_length_847_cov_5.090278.p7  ORF type:complete len:66 (+),score=32.25 NODE_19347_length_847_cov_5.090278:541-738(+)